MRKKLLPLLATTILCTSSINFTHAQQNGWCNTSEIFNDLIQKNPELGIKYDSMNLWLKENASSLQRESEAGPYIIPVVVHIIHNNGSENISDAQIASGIAQLNMDFQGTPNADHASVIPQFQSIIGHPNIEFRLARLDPNGNCTNGITRTVSTTTYDARDNAKVIYWPRNKYYNVWIVSNIYTSQPGTVTGGYAYYPGMAPSPNVDGIILAHNYFGTIGTSSGANFNKRVVSHETGHYLNLAHPWGGGNINNCSCGWGDGVDDTPCTSGSFSSCNLAQVTCDGTLDNVQNIMDYSTCTNMFTTDQVTRMLASLNGTAGQRNNLFTATNLAATGTNDGYTIVDCAPKAEFLLNNYVICKGASVTFTDKSWNGTPTSWHWNIVSGSNIITETTQNPTVTFTEPGVYNVTLTVSNSGGNGSTTKNAVVKVIDNTPAPAAAGYKEDFENNPIVNGDWQVDYSNQSANWIVTNSVSATGTSSAMFPNIGVDPNIRLSMYSPVYDFTNVTQNNLTFKYAYASIDSDSKDLLRVFVSEDCGNTWVQRGSYTSLGLNIASVGYQINNWAPTSSSDWSSKTISNLQNYLGKPSVMFKFEFTTGGGNNLYIDDINIGNTFGISTPDYLNTNIGLTVFPNPSEGVFTVAYQTKENDNTFVQVVDITGRVLYSTTEKKAQEGLQNETIQLQNAPAGMYFVNVYMNNSKFTEKVIIK